MAVGRLSFVDRAYPHAPHTPHLQPSYHSHRVADLERRGASPGSGVVSPPMRSRNPVSDELEANKEGKGQMGQLFGVDLKFTASAYVRTTVGEHNDHRGGNC